MGNSKTLTNEQILKKAIKKAIKNGWKVGAYSFATQFALDEYKKDQRSQYFIIFSHDFAKAFFGIHKVMFDTGEKILRKGLEGVSLPAWEYHLPDMVLEKDPIKYLEKFL